MNTIFFLSYFVITVQFLNHNNYNIVSYLFLSFEIYDIFFTFFFDYYYNCIWYFKFDKFKLK